MLRNSKFIFRSLITTRFRSSWAFILKVPNRPIPVESGKVSLSPDEVGLLERLSLVKCDTEAGVRVLEETIAFAELVLHVPADDVEPMHSVLENENLPLREDKVTEGDCQKDILRNAALIEEDYFVAPPGNIPLQATDNSAAQPKELLKLTRSEPTGT